MRRLYRDKYVIGSGCSTRTAHLIFENQDLEESTLGWCNHFYADIYSTGKLAVKFDGGDVHFNSGVICYRIKVCDVTDLITPRKLRT